MYNSQITGKKVYEAIKESAFHSFESYVARKQILEGGDIGKVCTRKMIQWSKFNFFLPGGAIGTQLQESWLRSGQLGVKFMLKWK